MLIPISLCLLGPAVGEVIRIRNSNWAQVLEGEWFIEFFAPWCPACKQFTQTWKDLSDYSSELGIKVADVDITRDHSLSGRFLITALPSIFHCKDGVCRRYQESRELDSLHSFISEEKWKSIEPLAWYRQPGNLLMSGVSCLFIFSANMQIFHEYLTDELGVNEYASYGLYIVLTIITGLTLGGIMVCITDMINARRRVQHLKKVKKDDPPVEPAEENESEEETEETQNPSENTTRRRVRKE